MTTTEIPIPPLPPMRPGECPAHPFDTAHDGDACRMTRINDALAQARVAVTHHLDPDETAWVIKYLVWRFGVR